MNRVKWFVRNLIVVAICIVMFPIVNVHAAPELTQQNFDYEWYLEQHSDLAAIFSVEDQDAIWEFYKTIGEPAGWLGRRTKISYLTKENFDYETFLGLNPDIYAVYGTDYDQIYDWYITTGVYEGRIAQTTSERINTQMEIYNIADSIINPEMSTREKVKAVHDWMCIHIAYDYDNYLNSTIPNRSYNVEGAIYSGTAVCSGYVRTFMSFMDVLGIPCEEISGKSDSGGGHAWNKVKIDGVWYWIDVTWDDPVPDKPGVVYWYKYFLITEEQMNQDHAKYK